MREDEAGNDLPEGWSDIRLQDHIYIAGRIGWRGLKAEEYTPTGPIFLSVPNLNYGDNVDFSNVFHIPKARFDESPEIQLRVGDTLLVKDGAGIGKLGYVAELPDSATVNSSLLVLRPADNLLLPKYLFYYLKGPKFQDIALQRITGSGTPHLFQRDIRTFQLLVPPVTEQRRIISKIEELLQDVNASRARLARVPKMIKAFRQSVLASACSGRLTEGWREKHSGVQSDQELLRQIDEQGAKGGNPVSGDGTDLWDLSHLPEVPDTWTWAAIHQVADVQGGIQKQPKRAPRKHAYPYLRVANVLRNRLDLSEIHKMEIFEGELETYGLQRGDLLIVEGNGSIAEIGRSALWDGEIKDCVHQNHIIRVRPRLCQPEYLNAYWNSPIGITRVMNAAVTTAGLFSLSTKKIAMLPAPIPPLEEQYEIVRRVAILFKLADKIEERIEAATKRADKLTQAILAKAFRGELVPTEAELARQEGREYEPASVLLEQIRADRERALSAHNSTSRRLRESAARK